MRHVLFDLEKSRPIDVMSTEKMSRAMSEKHHYLAEIKAERAWLAAFSGWIVARAGFAGYSVSFRQTNHGLNIALTEMATRADTDGGFSVLSSSTEIKLPLGPLLRIDPEQYAKTTFTDMTKRLTAPVQEMHTQTTRSGPTVSVNGRRLL